MISLPIQLPAIVCFGAVFLSLMVIGFLSFSKKTSLYMFGSTRPFFEEDVEGAGAVGSNISMEMEG